MLKGQPPIKPLTQLFPMVPKFRLILEMAIDEGVCIGYWKAHKHVEEPTPDAIIESIQEHVMAKMFEYFDFPEEAI
jgi:hypothetical protein